MESKKRKKSVSFQLKKSKRNLGNSKILGKVFNPDEEVDIEEQILPHQLRNPSALALESTQIKIRRLKEEGNLLAESGQFSAALTRWKEALSIAGENSVLYELQCQAYMCIHQYFAAVKAGEKAVELAPDWDIAHLTLGRAQFNFGELNLSLKTLKDGLSKAKEQQTREEFEEEIGHVTKLLSDRDAKLGKITATIREIEGEDAKEVKTCMSNLMLRGKLFAN